MEPNTAIALALAAGALVGGVVYLRLTYRVNWRAVARAVPKPAVMKTDEDWIRENKCPECHAEGTLLAGPSGGMSQNVACNACLMEFNVHHSFGGILKVDRTGEMSISRARVFGIEEGEYCDRLSRKVVSGGRVNIRG